MIRVAVILLGVLWLGGCVGPCEELANQACDHAGADSETCAWIQERADRATRNDKRACAVAVELVESLAKAK